MKEYEYIIEALEGYLCDELTCVICSENYTDRSYEHGYKNLFQEYRRLHQDFCDNREKYDDPAQGQRGEEQFRNECEMKRQDIQNRFVKDVQACTAADIYGSKGNYLKKLDEEEIKTVAKRICLYPYLVSVLRESRKGEGFHGKKI